MKNQKVRLKTIAELEAEGWVVNKKSIYSYLSIDGQTSGPRGKSFSALHKHFCLFSLGKTVHVKKISRSNYSGQVSVSIIIEDHTREIEVLPELLTLPLDKIQPILKVCPTRFDSKALHFDGFAFHVGCQSETYVKTVAIARWILKQKPARAKK